MAIKIRPQDGARWLGSQPGLLARRAHKDALPPSVSRVQVTHARRAHFNTHTNTHTHMNPQQQQPHTHAYEPTTYSRPEFVEYKVYLFLRQMAECMALALLWRFPFTQLCIMSFIMLVWLAFIWRHMPFLDVGMNMKELIISTIRIFGFLMMILIFLASAQQQLLDRALLFCQIGMFVT